MSGRMSGFGRAVAAVLVAGAFTMIPAIATAQTAGSTILVDAVDFGFKPGGQTVSPGDVTFAVKNSGTRPHELIVVKTDLEPRALPLRDGRVDEAAVQIIGRTSRIQPPAITAGVLTVNLPQGRYLAICNIGTHYAQGMTFSLVSGNAGTPSALVPPTIAPPAPAAAAAPAPAKTGTAGPLGTDGASSAVTVALAGVAVSLVLGARAWANRAR